MRTLSPLDIGHDWNERYDYRMHVPSIMWKDQCFLYTSMCEFQRLHGSLSLCCPCFINLIIDTVRDNVHNSKKCKKVDTR